MQGNMILRGSILPDGQRVLLKKPIDKETDGVRKLEFGGHGILDGKR